MGCFQSSMPVTQQVLQPKRILKYSLIRLVRKMLDVACKIYDGDAACVVLSSVDDVIITDAQHDDPSWIECWQNIHEQSPVPVKGLWLEYDPVCTITGLTVAWVAGAVMERNIGCLYIKGSNPRSSSCVAELQEFVKLVAQEFEAAYSGASAPEARIIINTMTEKWPILWVNAQWANMTDVTTGSFWKYFVQVSTDSHDSITVTPLHRPLLHMLLHLNRVISTSGFVVGTLCNPDVSTEGADRRASLDESVNTSVFDAHTSLSDEGRMSFPAIWNNRSVHVNKLFLENFTGVDTCMEDVKCCLALRHLNIVKYLAVDYRIIDANRIEVWLITELLEGVSLADMIDAGEFNVLRTHITDTLDYFKIISVIKQLVEGLQYLHDNNVMHGRLTIENVYLTTDRTVKVHQYGMVKLQGSVSVAPEQLNDGASVMKSDQYCFGIMMHEVLSGKRYVSGPLPRLSRVVPDSLKSLIEQCTANYETDRPNWSTILSQLNANLDFILNR